MEPIRTENYMGGGMNLPPASEIKIYPDIGDPYTVTLPRPMSVDEINRWMEDHLKNAQFWQTVR